MTTIDDERQLIIQVFATQCSDGLARMEESLLALEAHPEDDEALNTIFRICHTIKGDASILGFSDIANFAHVLEDLLEDVRSGQITAGEALTSLLLESRDAMDSLVRHACEGGAPEAGPKFDALLENLERWSEGSSSPRPIADEQPVEDTAQPVENFERAESEHRAKTNRTIRVRIDTLDRLVNLAGELAIGRSRVTQLIGQQIFALSTELREAHNGLERQFAELQEEIMRLRMVSVGPVFRQHLRTVRDVALSQGKRAHLEISGDDAELDTTVIDHLRECLGHMVRNSVSHGIESPQEREAAGKPLYGTIRLSAYHEGPNIVVQIQDDGAGLDSEAILAHSQAIGLVGESEQLSQSQIHNLIFEPGFSTASDTTLISGRGVGMDVVRRKIEALGGSVRIESDMGQGMTVTLYLPLTLAIVDGFAVRVHECVYLIPLSAVVECLDLPATTRSGNEGSDGLINLRGNPLPYIHLREILGFPRAPDGRKSIVVVHHNGTEAGFAVDQLLGETQAVIKPLGAMFRDLPSIAGATILGDGDVALILDVPSLLRTSIERSGGGSFQNSGNDGASASVAGPAAPTSMVST